MQIKPKHQNNGHCPHCAELFDKYPGFNSTIRSWFVLFQAANPEAHISCAGRGYEEQTKKVKEGRSNAQYGKSAHNYNCAIDVFCQVPGSDIYDLDWFETVLAPALPDYLEWYGRPEYANDKTKYYELPHIELKAWKKLRDSRLAVLVEPHPVVST